MDTPANRIKQALEIRNMKQADLVRLTGIGKSSISTYISGDYEPKQKNIYKIAAALNVNEAWLWVRAASLTAMVIISSVKFGIMILWRLFKSRSADFLYSLYVEGEMISFRLSIYRSTASFTVIYPALRFFSVIRN